MSLRVWLPFNKDLNNQGLDELLFNNYNVTLNDSGKIGKCALFNGTSSYIQFTNWTINNNPQLSICFWVNSNRGNLYGVFTSRASNTNPVHQLSLTNIGLSFRDTNHSSFTALSFTQPTIGIWTHYALIYDNGNWIIYKDGIEILNKTYSTATLNIINDIKIGRYLSSSSDVYFDGKLDDFRIYDHALSPVEVKEISRGLVLHYKLSERDILMSKCKNITWNQLANVHNISESTKNGVTVSSANGYLNISTTLEGATAATTFTNFYSETNLGFSQIEGHKYYSPNTLPTGVILASNTYSGGLVLCRNAIYTGKRGSSAQTWSLKITEGTIITTQTSCLILIFDLTMMFGEGNEPTIEEFEEMFPIKHYPYDSGTIVDFSIPISDSSGYNNNGIVNGNLILSNNTPRYQKCVEFNDGSSYITRESLNGDIKTVSVWFKTTKNKSTAQLIFADSNSRMAVAIYNGGLVTYAYNNTGGTGSRVVFGDAYIENGWNHIVVVSTGTTTRDAYCNGIKLSTTTNNYYNISDGNLYIGKRAISNLSELPFYGYISDLRVYATSLSEEDVRQLYEVSGKIDNIGNIHSYELNEYDEGRELLILNLTSSHTNYGTTHLKYSSDGIEFTAYDSIGTEYIEINPTGHKYIYDFTVSVAAGDQFYIGFERFDANKTSRSNNACTYIISTKPATDVVKKRYRGTVTLKTDGVNPCKYIRLRILNGWSGSASDSTKKATVHSMSLREIPEDPVNKTKLTKTGVFKTDLLLEENTKVEVEKNLYTDINEFIEI